MVATPRKKSLLIHASHPVQYHAPLFRELDENSNIDCMVMYCSDIGVKSIFQPEFNTVIKWDVSLLDGYRYLMLKNYAIRQGGGFFSRINPGLFRVISKKRYDAILIQGYNDMSCWMAFFAAKLSGLKIIWRGEATLRPHGQSSNLKAIIKKNVLTRFFKKCDALMFSCTGNKDYLAYYGASESKLFPIPCAVDNEYFCRECEKYSDAQNEIKNELGIDPGDFIVLFSARFTKRKRPFDLLRAVSEISHHNLTILFVGDGLERSTMEAYVKKNGIKAVFVGFINQGTIAKYYCIANVAVVISEYDPSPKAMNEAMNFKLPVIVTNIVGTATDLVKHGTNGFIVGVGDVPALAAHLDYLNTRRGKALEMGEESFKIVRDWNFSKDVEGLERAMKFVTGE